MIISTFTTTTVSLSSLWFLAWIVRQYHDDQMVHRDQLLQHVKQIGCGRYLAGVENLRATKPWLKTRVAAPAAAEWLYDKAIGQAVDAWAQGFPRLEHHCSPGAFEFYQELYPKDRTMPNINFRIIHSKET